MSRVGFCIGNGTSRVDYDLTRLDGHGVTIGCNSIWKHYTPDYVVALDKHEAVDVQAEPRPFKIITRDDSGRHCYYFALDGVYFAPVSTFNEGQNNNSGIVAAVYLADRLQMDKVYMLGIDFFRDVIGRTSNDLYSKTTIGTTDLPRIWTNITKRNPNTEFIRVGNIESYDREFFDNDLKGFTLMNYEEFPY